MYCKTRKLLSVLCIAALLGGCAGEDVYDDGSSAAPDGGSSVQPPVSEKTPEPEGDTYEDVVNKAMLVTYNGQEYNGYFTGTLKNGRPDGEGKFEPGSSVDYFAFKGEWVDGEPSGEGEMQTDHYTIDFGTVKRTGTFLGHVKDLVAEGEGSFDAYNDADERYHYTGNFANGTFNGHGRREFPEETKYGIEEGNFTDGLFDPTFAEEVQYIFSFQDNMKLKIAQPFLDYINDEEDLFTIPDKEVVVLEEFESYDPSNHPGITMLEGLYVTQVTEENGYNSQYQSIIAKNDSHVFDILWFGDNMSITAGDTITAYVLTLGDSYYMSRAQLRIDAAAALAVWLEKTEE
ncbi:MAG: hypothetical protein K6G61_07145 [Solobacterium sp.]|nr:hypothetical protein [Solobacterium sp.]